MSHIMLVDLKQENYSITDTPEWFKDSYLGGIGFLAKLLYDNIRPKTDAFSEDNLLGISTGPLTGRTLYSGRFVLGSKSPLTNGWGESHTGGNFGIAMNTREIDSILIKGSTNELSYVLIDGNGARIIKYPELEHRGTGESTKMLLERHGETSAVITIGPAGENLVRYANMCSDGKNFAGRSGLGAVMGSKKLKGVVIVPDANIDLQGSDEVNKYLKNKVTKMNLREYGTAHLLDLKNDLRCLPTKNHKHDVFDYADEIDVLRLIDNGKKTSYGCPLCIIKCKKTIKIDETTHRLPEYETFYSLGSNCMNRDIFSILELNQLCNDLGLDTISTGVVLSFLMECFEKELYKKTQLQWGSPTRMRDLIKQIAYRTGQGDLLAEGVKRVSEQIPNSEKYAMHVKGMETPGQDPRTHPSMTLGHATAPRGADHLTAFSTYDEGILRLDLLERRLYGHAPTIPEVVVDCEDLCTLADSLIICKSILSDMMIFSKKNVTDMLSLVTGKQFDIGQVTKRISDTRRVFNVREGFTRTDDSLPQRILTEKLTKREHSYDTNKLDMLLDEYYQRRGWSADGIPTQEKTKDIEKNTIKIV